MSHNIDEVTPIGQIARKYPSAIAVFEELDIDYACKGGRSLAEAARASGFETGTVLEALEAVIPAGPAIEPRVSDLLHTIVTEHHRFEAARFRDLAARIESPAFANVFAARIRTILTELASSVSAHMLREETNLFPRIEELDLRPHKVRAGSISRPLLNEFIEHDVVCERIEKIRELALRLRNVEGSDVQLLDELDEFYRAVHRHIHLENNVLIPLVIDLENRLKASRQADRAI
jgi:regulator of cell morphogenesis and NO signaling